MFILSAPKTPDGVYLFSHRKEVMAGVSRLKKDLPKSSMFGKHNITVHNKSPVLCIPKQMSA